MAKRDKASIYVDRMLAEFEIVKVELRFAIEKHIVKNPGKNAATTCIT